jgi:hypothetical protein
MTATLDGKEGLLRARAIGSVTGIAVAVATGAVLSFYALFASHNLGLLVALIFSTVGVALFARSAGRIAGEQIASRSFPATLVVGVVSGFAALLVAALCAALSGFAWCVHDGFRDSGWAWSYLGKPFFAVLAYGCIVASLVGIVAALIIRGLLGHKSV